MGFSSNSVLANVSQLGQSRQKENLRFLNIQN
jgi:hypothetical protein